MGTLGLHVGIHEADLGALLRERYGQVHRDSGFSHAPLTATDGNRVLDGGNKIVLQFGRIWVWRAACVHFTHEVPFQTLDMVRWAPAS